MNPTAHQLIRALFFLFTVLFTLPATHCTATPREAPQKAAECAVQTRGGNSEGLPTDLNAALLVAAPGNDIYSGWGHCALRLWCPSRGLDFFFTYGLELTGGNRWRFFTGRSRARFHVMRAGEYVSAYRAENRTLEQYRLNLTPEETRTLWRLADEGAQESAARDLTFQDHCAAEVLRLVAACLQDGTLNYGRTVTYTTFRQFFNRCSAQCPWAAFWWKMLYGAEGDEPCSTETLLNPMVLVPVLRHTTIEESDGFVRPLLADGGQPSVLFRARADGPATPGTLQGGTFVCRDRTHGLYRLVTPTGVAAWVLLITAGISLGQWRRHWHRLPRLCDAVLLAVQSLAGLLVMFCTFFSAKAAFHGNVRVAVLNVVPLAVWLAARCCPRFRTSAWYGRAWLAMGAVCVLFALSAPFSPQIEAPYVLVALAFALRCGMAARRCRQLTE